MCFDCDDTTTKDSNIIGCCGGGSSYCKGGNDPGITSNSNASVESVWNETQRLMEKSEQLVQIMTHVCSQQLSGVFRTVGSSYTSGCSSRCRGPAPSSISSFSTSSSSSVSRRRPDEAQSPPHLQPQQENLQEAMTTTLRWCPTCRRAMEHQRPPPGGKEEVPGVCTVPTCSQCSCRVKDGTSRVLRQEQHCRHVAVSPKAHTSCSSHCGCWPCRSCDSRRNTTTEGTSACPAAGGQQRRSSKTWPRRTSSWTWWLTAPCSRALTVLLLVATLARFTDGCSSRSTPKPRPPSPTLRPNITFQTYACPPAYAAWYCLNGATCFTVKVGESILYNCECADGYMGQRCEFKDLDGSYLTGREKLLVETASIAGGATVACVLVFVVLFSLYVFMQKEKDKRTKDLDGGNDRQPFSGYQNPRPEIIRTIQNPYAREELSQVDVVEPLSKSSSSSTPSSRPQSPLVPSFVPPGHH